MKHYGIEMIDEFLLQKIETLPTHTIDDKGRLVFVSTTGNTYFATGSQWKSLSINIPIVVSANYNAKINDMILASTYDRSFTILLPKNASTGDMINIMDRNGSFGLNHLFVSGQNRTIDNKDELLIADLPNVDLIFTYDGTNRNWFLEIENFGVFTP